MALTTQAAALTEAHRVEQNKNGALVAYVVAQLWLRSIDANDISGSAAKLIERLIPLLRGRRKDSALLARQYYPAFRRLEGMQGDGFKLPDLSELNVEQLATSLRVTGPVAAMNRIGSLPVGEDGRVNPVLIRAAIEDTAVDISGAATRHVMNGGRDELQNAVQADELALGYVRVTDADPCYFCAMLASRGPVYGDDSFDESDPRFIGEGSHKVHDHCGCSVEPVFSREAQWPGRAREFEDMWLDLSNDLHRAPTLKDWRRRFEGR